MQAAFKRWGNSHGIIIPKPILEVVGIGENEPVNVSIENGAIVIRKPVPGKKTIEDFFKGYTGRSETLEIDWGVPRGKEVW